MRKHHPKNERVKRRYFIFLEEAKRMNPKTVDQVAAAIASFEESTKWRNFQQFHIEQARRIKRNLEEQIVKETGKPLAVATRCSRLRHLKAFFQWLSEQPGYRSRIAYSDAEYFNPSNNDGRIAGAVRDLPVPTLEQLRFVLNAMPNVTEIDMRNRALFAFTLLSGARDDAVVSMSLKHVDLERCIVFQDAREVRTKNRKTFTSKFFPVGADFEMIVRDWITYLQTEKQFDLDAPLFPSTAIGQGEDLKFQATGISQEHWKSAGPVRRIFREAFANAGQPYFYPHLFRKTLTREGQKVCSSPEEFKAWSQNLGHESMATTFFSYGQVPTDRQRDIMDSLATRVERRGQGAVDSTDTTPPDKETIARVLAYFQEQSP